VWGDHLLPLLTSREAARLGSTCKALRGMVREHHRGDLGRVKAVTLQAALTTFPRARTLELYGSDESGGALVQWLREGRRGRYLERMTTNDSDDPVTAVVHEALRQGALPLLKRVDVTLEFPAERALLTEGHVAAMHELHLTIDCVEDRLDVYPQLAALGLVRQLPALTRLELEVQGYGDDPVQWPPFIPPPLKSLCIEIWSVAIPSTESLMRALPGMLEAGEARLERLEVYLPEDFPEFGDGLVHLAQALRCCSPTLNNLLIGTCVPEAAHDPDRAQDRPEPTEWLRVQWADLLAGVSSCRELHELVLSHNTVEPLFPPGTAFGRLTHLEISDREREHPPDAGVMGLWELMASGGLPALAKLRVEFEGRWGGVEEVRSRVAPALEAMAGTLIQLCLEKADFSVKWRSDEVDVGYELGVAVGKLRRLKDLQFDLFKDGRVYHAFAQGLAASGGGGALSPCCGGLSSHGRSRPMPTCWRACSSRVCASSTRTASTFNRPC
jgi:hypothetical protein